MSILGFIGLVLLITLFVVIHIAFMKGANSDKQVTPDCSCKMCKEFDTPEVDHEWHELPKTTQPKVYTLDCDKCVWRHPSTCKHCAIERNDAKVDGDVTVRME